MTGNEDIQEIASRYGKSSDKEKRLIEESICEICAPLVHKIAYKYRKAIMTGATDMDDNIQNGFQGLLTAIRSYDPESGVKFLTYAFSCVRKAVYFGVRDINIAGRSKARANARLQQYKKRKAELQGQLGHVPSVREISLDTGWKMSAVLTYERQTQSVRSLDFEENSDYFPLNK